MRATLFLLLIGSSDAAPPLSDPLFAGSGLFPWVGIIVAVVVVTVTLAQLGRPTGRRA